MKRVLLVLLLFLTGCEYYQVDCEKYPSATVCQSNEVDKPIIEIEEPPVINICEVYPGHAECIDPFSELKSHSQRKEVLPDWGPLGQYDDGFFKAHITFEAYLSNDQNVTDYKDVAVRLAEKYHRYADKYNTYEGIVNVKTINDNPSEKHYLDKELYDLIKFSTLNYPVSNGYFDISFAPVIDIWSDTRDWCGGNDYINPGCELPSMASLEEAVLLTGVDKLILNDDEMSIVMNEGMSIDLGGVAKGYFAEVLANEFAQRGLRAFVINAGGNIKTYGTKPSGELYNIYIQDPFKPRGEGALEEELIIPGGYSVVSSGDQEKYFIYEDEIYPHIVSPFTLWPDRYFRQVTIITNDSRAADILSTTVYLMPIEEGMAYVNGLDNVEALWVGLNGEIIKSDGMADFIK